MEAAGIDSITVDKSLNVSLTISLSHVFSRTWHVHSTDCDQRGFMVWKQNAINRWAQIPWC